MAGTSGKVAMTGGASHQRNPEDAPSGSGDDAGELIVVMRLQDGAAHVAVTALVRYGGRVAGATSVIDADAEMRALLDRIVADHGPDALRQARREAARATLVAMDRGEEL